MFTLLFCQILAFIYLLIYCLFRKMAGMNGGGKPTEREHSLKVVR